MATTAHYYFYDGSAWIELSFAPNGHIHKEYATVSHTHSEYASTGHIHSNYPTLANTISSLTASGRTITYTMADGTTGTITTQDTNTTYSVATADTLGLIKLGFAKAGKSYPVQLDAKGRAYVYVPWTDSGSGDFGDSISLGGIQLAADMSSGGLLINGSKIATEPNVPAVLSEKGIQSDTHVLSRANSDTNDGGHIVFNKPDGSYTAIGAYGGFRAYWFVNESEYRAFGVYTDGSITINGSFGVRKLIDAYGDLGSVYRLVWGNGTATDFAISLSGGVYIAFTADGYCVPFSVAGGTGGGQVADTSIGSGEEITYNILYKNGIIYCRKINQREGYHHVEAQGITGIYLFVKEMQV